MKKNLNFNTLVMIFAVVALVALITWIVPGGEYSREIKDGKTLVVPNSFKYVEGNPQGIGALFMSPLTGFVKAAAIIGFLFIIGGAFSIIQKTGAIKVSVQRLAYTFARKPHLEKYFIPITMIIFSTAGSIFASSEEALPFILIFIPLAWTMGYDSIVGTAIPFLGLAAGFAGATLNPFTVGIAQSIAELPLYSGLGYRVIIWLISTASMITFVMVYAKKVKAKPEISPMFSFDNERKKSMNLDNKVDATFTIQHKMVLLSFLVAMVILIVGILGFKWYITELGALFLALGIVAGFAGRLNLNQMTDAFKDGARDMVGVALIIGCARAILVIATDGKVIDTMLFSLSGLIVNLHPVVASQAMFVMQGVINFFVHSASGQAMLTMPVMSPLADVLGVSRQIAVLAFQFGEGWINPILPTSGVTMGVLGLAGIPWDKWFKWMLPVQLFFFILALLLLIPPFFFNY
ncbi:MAG: TIGR00366 family protein [Ignavibacteriales bacterium]|nr:TIGR00366 family protein [Ignavibacteriales bacterium]